MPQPRDRTLPPTEIQRNATKMTRIPALLTGEADARFRSRGPCPVQPPLSSSSSGSSPVIHRYTWCFSILAATRRTGRSVPRHRPHRPPTQLLRFVAVPGRSAPRSCPSTSRSTRATESSRIESHSSSTASSPLSGVRPRVLSQSSNMGSVSRGLLVSWMVSALFARLSSARPMLARLIPTAVAVSSL
jgi:hypothetical protein